MLGLSRGVALGGLTAADIDRSRSGIPRTGIPHYALRPAAAGEQRKYVGQQKNLEAGLGVENESIGRATSTMRLRESREAPLTAESLIPREMGQGSCRG